MQSENVQSQQAAAASLTTTKFQFAIPFVLQSTSPSLAALHATRTRLLHHPDPATNLLASSWCPICGQYLHDGSGTIRSVRKPTGNRKKVKRTSKHQFVRVLRKTCHVCGHSSDTPIRPDQHGVPQNPPAIHNEAPPSSSSRPSSTSTPDPPSRRQHVQAISSSTTTERCHSPHTPRGVLTREESVHPETPSSGPSTPIPTVPKARTKKHRGLQDMLARNRERQEQERKSDSQNKGLSAFLEGL
ncbi:hypothetical protein NLI96_g12451 [Meripilus lineatus]|uniref:Uncharacterized protein n=1 Tax=Meripilus lineatus TaxID=2056292 RepID=A0AAD5USA1_9APHY|nr:hypothetical protein NLI96_g12451 [Physisporinus lineatus]